MLKICFPKWITNSKQKCSHCTITSDKYLEHFLFLNMYVYRASVPSKVRRIRFTYISFVVCIISTILCPLLSAPVENLWFYCGNAPDSIVCYFVTLIRLCLCSFFSATFPSVVVTDEYQTQFPLNILHNSTLFRQAAKQVDVIIIFKNNERSYVIYVFVMIEFTRMMFWWSWSNCQFIIYFLIFKYFSM